MIRQIDVTPIDSIGLAVATSDSTGKIAANV